MKLGEGLEEIGAGAFEDCSLIHDISIPPAVKAIGKCAFRRLLVRYLTVLKLGNGLEEIGAGAFRECTSLNER